MFLFGALVPLAASGNYNLPVQRPVETPALKVEAPTPQPDPTP